MIKNSIQQDIQCPLSRAPTIKSVTLNQINMVCSAA